MVVDAFLLKLKLGKRADEIVKEFMSNWEIRKDGVISWEEFLEHYMVDKN